MTEPKVPEEPSPEETPGDPLEEAMRLAFRSEPTVPWGDTPWGSSVVMALREKTGGMPQLVLRDAEEERSLVVKPLSSRISGSPGSVGPGGAGAGSSGRYQVFGEIGRGGVGSVLKGRDMDLNRDVALKVLLGSHGASPEMVKRFVEEAQIGGQLQHPGIVPVYDLGLLSGERPYFAMKLVKGQTLAALLEARGDPSRDRRRFLGVFEQVCQTVAYAHARGVIHRDLKPSNVMVGAFGEVLVMDWGLAKVLSSQAEDKPRKPQAAETVIRTVRSETPGSESQVGLAMGTPAYMSPEQARGEVDELDERSDVFGLGAILCEILTGEPPYVGQTAEGLRRKAASGQLEYALSRLDASGAEDELLGIAKRCLSPEPLGRPRDAGVVAREVGAYLAAVEERARAAALAAAEARVKAEDERRARKLTVALAASILIALVLGGGGYFLVEQDRRARAVETASAVGRALEEATLLWGQAKAAAVGDLSKWSEALSAGKRAEALALAGRAEGATLARVGGLLRDLEEEDGKARKAAEQAEADRRMVERLEEIRTQHGDVFDWMTQEPEYAKVFRDYGIDTEVLEPEEAAKRIRESAISQELSAALDHWTYLRKGARGAKDESWKKLARMAKEADPDPWRGKLREAREAGDLEKLRALAASPEVIASSSWTLDFLASALDSAGDRKGAESIYRTAHRLYPGDFWINHNLGRLLLGLKPPQWQESNCFFTAALALRPQSSHVWIDLGVSLHNKGDYEGAIAASREAIRLKPDSAEAHTNLGSALDDKGDFEGAIASCKEAIRLNPDDAKAHTNLGSALDHKGDIDSAVAAYREAIRIKPDLVEAHYNLGNALRQKGDNDGAIAAYREAIRLKPDDPTAHNNLGVTLNRKGDHDGAIAACREAIRLKPDDAMAHNSLGNALDDKGDLEGAIAAYKEAIRLKRDEAEGHNNLGNALRRKGDLDGAIAALREAIRLKPDLVEAHANLGTALCDKGDLDAAVAAHRKAIRLRPDLASVHTGLGVALYTKGDYKGAIAAHREAIRLEPDLAMAHGNLGVALGAKGDYDAAIAAYREAIRLKPDLAEAHTNLGNALRTKGDLDGAIAAHREAIRLKPKFAQAHNNLGTALYGKRDYEGAIAALREAIRINPGFVEAHFGLGLTLMDKADLDGAIAAFTEVIRLKPDLLEAHGNLGRALCFKGDYDAAIAAFREVLRRKPGSGKAYFEIGNALSGKGDLDGAIAAFREATRLEPDDPMAHYNIGCTLARKGDLDGAIGAYREAIRVGPNHAEAHCNLADSLQAKGLYREALAAFRCGHELGSKRPGWPYPSETWVRQCERLVELDSRLAAIQGGESEPAGSQERIALARHCYRKRLCSASAGFWKSAFEEDPKLADDLEGSNRYDAACAAALAGCGQGSDAGALDDAARVAWRSQALEWLRADLSLLGRKLDTVSADEREAVRRTLEHWKRDRDLAGLRDKPGLDGLPEAEREACRALWAEVEAVLKRATEGGNPTKGQEHP